ncbi:MAG: hypothetical protein HY904_10360 [Deltaproteobacteria bacterium]|nr:hypothetical protein [Deltaproteobacteria bacterium]
MSVGRSGGGNIQNTLRSVTQDGTLDKTDAEKLLGAAGSTVSAREEKDLKAASQGSGFTVTAEARQFLATNLRDIASLRRQAEQQNAMVARRQPALAAQEQARLDPTKATRTLGGTPIPDDVKKLINTALAAGAVAYDVAELGNPAKDDHGEGFTITGKWTPYPQEIAPGGNMAFDYTEVTPQKLQDDMEKSTTYTRIKGYKSETQRDMRTGETHTFQVAEYEKVTGKGTGDIMAHYDEATHPDQYARGTNNQKWANNYAILADGSLHCLPAARRNPGEPGLILTNPSLARGQRMLANGHIEVRGGVVTSIGISGRIQKLAQDGDAKFLDPVPLLKAWGFKIAPDVKVTFEGGGPDPKIDPNTHVIG